MDRVNDEQLAKDVVEFYRLGTMPRSKLLHAIGLELQRWRLIEVNLRQHAGDPDDDLANECLKILEGE